MKKVVIWLIVALMTACKPGATPSPEPVSKLPLRGTDFSQLPKIEQYNYPFRATDSSLTDPLDVLADAGLNCVRLKVWNNDSGDASLQELVPYVERIKDKGMQVMLTLHYSNTWADPGHQNIPTAWETLDFEHLLDSVESFTFEVVKKLKPDYIQIGNEINHGFMHPAGVRDGSGQFQKLLASGIQGAKSADSSVITILHYAGFANADVFYSTVDSLDYDWIGLSYYPKWHTSNIVGLEATCHQLAQDFQRPVSIVETSYAFTLGWNDWTNNHIGWAADLHPDYPATKQGQSDFIARLRTITDSLGTGLMYWGGELVAYKGPEATDGSPYENQALFDFNGIPVPALEKLGKN
ncbi:MAG: hypothetical protein RL754_353 [Bacteroidota bacterium]